MVGCSSGYRVRVWRVAKVIGTSLSIRKGLHILGLKPRWLNCRLPYRPAHRIAVYPEITRSQTSDHPVDSPTWPRIACSSFPPPAAQPPLCFSTQGQPGSVGGIHLHHHGNTAPVRRPSKYRTHPPHHHAPSAHLPALSPSLHAPSAHLPALSQSLHALSAHLPALSPRLHSPSTHLPAPTPKRPPPACAATSKTSRDRRYRHD
jgi:hypothetical protein